MRKRLVILADYGLDDAVATVHLLQHQELFSGIDILAIAGNSTCEVSLRNARVLLSNYIGDKSCVRIVDTSALNQYSSPLAAIHGEDGMGDLLTLREESVAVIDYESFVKDIPSCIIASFGPATVTVDLLKYCKNYELLIMGGNVSEEPNYMGYEFNHALDLVAFDELLKFKHVVATLDTARVPLFNYAAWKFGDDLLGQLMERARVLAVNRHSDNCYIYDYIAAKYLTHPEIFTIITKTDIRGNSLNMLMAK